MNTRINVIKHIVNRLNINVPLNCESSFSFCSFSCVTFKPILNFRLVSLQNNNKTQEQARQNHYIREPNTKCLFIYSNNFLDMNEAKKYIEQ